jgi:hypothetical protein
MILRTTHTFVELPLSPAAYEEIRNKLKAAGYEHCFIRGEDTIDMHGLAVTREETSVKEKKS